MLIRKLNVMPFVDAADLAAFPASPARILALDVGTKTVGLAVSDPQGMVATPVDTLRRRKWSADADALVAVIDGRDVAGLVVGWPLNMNGSEGPRCQGVRQFSRNLLARVDLPLVLWDERWSTAGAERHLIAADVSRRRRADVIDSHAAAWILQGFLDARRARVARVAEPSHE